VISSYNVNGTRQTWVLFFFKFCFCFKFWPFAYHGFLTFLCIFKIITRVFILIPGFGGIVPREWP
jgi:hypothetical protein